MELIIKEKLLKEINEKATSLMEAIHIIEKQESITNKVIKETGVALLSAKDKSFYFEHENKKYKIEVSELKEKAKWIYKKSVENYYSKFCCSNCYAPVFEKRNNNYFMGIQPPIAKYCWLCGAEMENNI